MTNLQSSPLSQSLEDSICFSRIYNHRAAESGLLAANTFITLLTELADVIVGVGLWHGRDSHKWAAVPSKGFTEDLLSQVDLRGPQILQF